MLQPRLLLVDEPTIGLEPRAVQEVFATLQTLKESDGVAILMVEQNASRTLRFADVGYVLVAGRIAHAAAARELLDDPGVARLFLDGAP